VEGQERSFSAHMYITANINVTYKRGRKEEGALRVHCCMNHSGISHCLMPKHWAALCADDHLNRSCKLDA